MNIISDSINQSTILHYAESRHPTRPFLNAYNNDLNSYRRSAPLYEMHGIRIIPIIDKRPILKHPYRKGLTVKKTLAIMYSMGIEDAQVGFVLDDSKYVIMDIDDLSKSDVVYGKLNEPYISYDTDRGLHSLYLRGKTLRSKVKKNMNGVDALLSGHATFAGRTIVCDNVAYTSWYRPIESHETTEDIIEQFAEDLGRLTEIHDHSLSALQSRLIKKAKRETAPRLLPKKETIQQGARNISLHTHIRGCAYKFEDISSLFNYAKSFCDINMVNPLPDNEIMSVVKSAMRYHKRDGSHNETENRIERTRCDIILERQILRLLDEVTKGRKHKHMSREGLKNLTFLLKNNKLDDWFIFVKQLFNTHLKKSRFGSVENSTVKAHRDLLINIGAIQVVSSLETGFAKKYDWKAGRATKYKFTQEFQNLVESIRLYVASNPAANDDTVVFEMKPLNAKGLVVYKKQKVLRYLSCDVLRERIRPYMWKFAGLRCIDFDVDGWGRSLHNISFGMRDKWKIFPLVI